jgi:hypothetical protein
VFLSMGVDRIACPHCAALLVSHDDEDSWHRFSTSIDDWYADGGGSRTCEHCGETVGLNDWDWSPLGPSATSASNSGTGPCSPPPSLPRYPSCSGTEPSHPAERCSHIRRQRRFRHPAHRPIPTQGGVAPREAVVPVVTGYPVN